MLSYPDQITVFLDQVCSHLAWSGYRSRVRRELFDHMATRVEYLISERDFSESDAIKQTIQWMGDPDEIGIALHKAYSPFLKLCYTLFAIVLWIGIAACAIYLLLQI